MFIHLYYVGISGSAQRSRNETPSVHIRTAHCIQFCSTFADNIVCVAVKTASSNKRINAGVGLGISMCVWVHRTLSLWWYWSLNPGKHGITHSVLTLRETCTYADGMGYQRLFCASDRTCCGSNRPKCLLSLLVYMFMTLLWECKVQRTACRL